MTAIAFRGSGGLRARQWVPALLAGVVIMLVAWMYFAWLGGGQPGDGRSGGDRAPGAVRGGSRVNGTPPDRATLQAIPRPGLPVVDLVGLRWKGFHGIELPTSMVAGPSVARGGLAWGFARTPLGALLAAVNIGVRANAQWGPGVFVPTIRGQVIGADAAALLAGCRAAYEQARRVAGLAEGRSLGRVFAAEQGFRWVSYSPGAAVVDIVSAGQGGQGVLVRAVTEIWVRWSRGDWRVVAPPGGDWGNAAFPLRSPRGYTFFPAPAA